MKESKTAKDDEIIAKRQFILDVLVGFSIFLVVAAFAYMILNPGKGQSDARNSTRNADVLSIMQSMSKYVDATGNIPSMIPLNRECASIGNEICRTGSLDCKNYVDLSTTLAEGDIKSLPVDTFRTEGNGTGYYISNDGEGSIVVCAPLAEREVTISIKQFMY
ncbi:MAG: hypothetical protein UR96_C0032G0011 [candidate division WS6 bacterium GW2011_GWC1_36_11]|uniref:Type II secretion system protein GspG C-terminal domain-containing protein n=2 Tax=Candidatus Dojkabacteria TaxID=74243 RepID=A0A0G0DAM0_9BACT|nr:MAG: hypothetical protein UR96_C0032G0011 [candidate division WS6 bacterium GW2011_GWC1_36_11]KKQ04068.1 MAG: hypothetical protein US14_C0025G0004 [candidate division WS6 bacterium GW2011_WS6_36_26]KKQ11679.1 MAG: hypothetical protein US24_C0019G0004 [candidate division WS6 bacterium GW2011_GWC2_36_7]HAM37306.1 hypothetical protein [Patescibacteria group bacterium]HAM96336.1 hypothetical protein [Patescibacteria group bacterium]